MLNDTRSIASEAVMVISSLGVSWPGEPGRCVFTGHFYSGPFAARNIPCVSVRAVLILLRVI